ncbi:MAG: CheR family methyltransferase [bacterium]
MNEQEFERFRTLIYQLAGIRVAPTKQILISNRLRRRLKETGISNFENYYRHLTSPAGKAEVAFFLDAITTNETYFFRDLSQFEWLGGPFLKEMTQAVAKGTHTRRLRVWSAASSSGEELYTISIVLREHSDQIGGWRLELLGTDLSQQVLDPARNGIYEERALRLVTAARRSAYFQQDAGTAGKWKVKADIRALSRWKRHNLMNPLVGEEPFDVVFLKNVLIYFDNDSKEKVLRNVVASIRPGGFLVVGPTDSVSKHLSQMTRERPWLFRK